MKILLFISGLFAASSAAAQTCQLDEDTQLIVTDTQGQTLVTYISEYRHLSFECPKYASAAHELECYGHTPKTPVQLNVTELKAGGDVVLTLLNSNFATNWERMMQDIETRRFAVDVFSIISCE